MNKFNYIQLKQLGTLLVSYYRLSLYYRLKELNTVLFLDSQCDYPISYCPTSEGTKDGSFVFSVCNNFRHSKHVVKEETKATSLSVQHLMSTETISESIWSRVLLKRLLGRQESRSLFLFTGLLLQQAFAFQTGNVKRRPCHQLKRIHSLFTRTRQNQQMSEFV